MPASTFAYLLLSAGTLHPICLFSLLIARVLLPLPVIRHARKARQKPGFCRARKTRTFHCNLMSCDVTVLVSGLSVKRMTAVIFVKGNEPVRLPLDDDCEPPDDDDELELDDPPVPM